MSRPRRECKSSDIKDCLQCKYTDCILNDKVKRRQKADARYYQKHKDKILKYHKELYLKNKEKIKIQNLKKTLGE